MRSRADREVDAFVREAERRGACLDSRPGRLHKLLEARVRAGRLVSPLPRLYARKELWGQLDPTSRTVFVLRGLQQLHPDWVFCGRSAAVAYGLAVSWGVQDVIEIASASGRARTADPHVVRRYVRGDEARTSFGMRVTSPLRTLFDCMRTLGFREGLAIADSALHVGLVGHEELVRYVRGMRGGFAGAAQARETAELADPRPENGMESIARAVMRELGFAAPELQVPFEDPMRPGHVFRVDFCWTLPDGTVIVGELDGAEKYRNPLMSGGSPGAALAAERRRESRISIGRPRIVRFTPEEVLDVAYLDRLLETYGVPRDREPTIEVPAGPPAEPVPVEAYGLG